MSTRQHVFADCGTLSDIMATLDLRERETAGEAFDLGQEAAAFGARDSECPYEDGNEKKT